jgi:hypothetical protein
VEFLAAAEGAGEAATSGEAVAGEESKAGVATGAEAEVRFSFGAIGAATETAFRAASAVWIRRPIKRETARSATMHAIDMVANLDRVPTAGFLDESRAGLLRRLTKPSSLKYECQI